MKKGNANTKKRGKLLRIILLSLVSLVVLVFGAIYISAAQMSASTVPIVTGKPEAKATPAPTSNLELITGEPEDIGEDADLPTPGQTEEPIYKQEPLQTNVINILIVGQDIRPNQSGRGRSDTMMLLTYNRKLGSASMTSFMRDSWVPIEGHDWNRINATYSFGGIGLTINTMNKLFDLDIQNYIILDFTGMISLVDQIGGIDVPLTAVEADYYNKTFDNMNVHAGVNHLNGAQTLLHARNRKSNGGDFERVRRQQDVMLAIFSKIKQTRDPVALSKILSYFLTQVKTNMSPNQLFSIALEIVGSNNLGINRYRIPIDGSWKYANMEGRSVLAIDIEKNKQYLHHTIYK